MSGDSQEKNDTFREKLDLPFPLVGDPEGTILRAYEVRWPLIGLAKRVTYVAKVLSRNGVITLVGLISPFKAFRQYAREEIGDFIEVFVDTSLDECIKRDPKGLYKKALAGEIKDLTGLQDPYEAPDDPELVIPTEDVTVGEAADMVIDSLREHGYL